MYPFIFVKKKKKKRKHVFKIRFGIILNLILLIQVQKWLELNKCVSLSTGLNEGTFPVDQPYKVYKPTAAALQDNPTAVERHIPMGM